MDDLELQKEFKRSLQADHMRMVEEFYMVVLDVLESRMRYREIVGKPPSGMVDLPAGLGEFAASRGGLPDEDFWLDVLEYVWPRLTEGLDSFADFDADLLEKDPKRWPGYIKSSRTDPLAWKTLEALLRRGSSLVARAEAAPADDQKIWEEGLWLLIKWAWEVASKTRTEPKRSQGRDSTDLMLRNAAIRATVQKVHDCSERPYTNDYHEERSACGVVARRLGMEYPTVRTIWRDRAYVNREDPKKSPIC